MRLAMPTAKRPDCPAKVDKGHIGGNLIFASGRLDIAAKSAFPAKLLSQTDKKISDETSKSDDLGRNSYDYDLGLPTGNPN
ncbi:hypothetical protein [Microvirga zambiensis]|uniref:hypothetical protein n=1 Tax=Microvirga zambiensis TaxID=1402137 RepID=UPI00191EB44C|nr:hypothetical protein [Microvirga zambiensis]